MNREQRLLHEIERSRKLLNDRSKETSLLSEEIVAWSRELDKLLNEYDALINRPDVIIQSRNQ